MLYYYVLRRVATFALAAFATFAAPAQKRYVFQRGLFGTQFTLTLHAPDSATALRARDAVYARMDTLNVVMSDYLDGSELNRLSATSGTGQAVRISDDLFRVLAVSLRIAEQSGGRFDPTIGPLSQLWRRAVRRGEFPTGKQRSAARRAVGWRYVALDSVQKTATLLRPNMRLDLGGIGQGFAAEEAAQTLRSLGLMAFLLDIGGDVLAGNAPPDQPEGWRVALDTAYGQGATLLLKNAAVTTSGDLVRHLDYRGKRYSHVMNPSSGLGLRYSVQTTVLAPTGTYADALTKVFSVASARQGRRLVRRWPGITVWRLETRRGRTVATFFRLP